jgi:hypothetical protein
LPEPLPLPVGKAVHGIEICGVKLKKHHLLAVFRLGVFFQAVLRAVMAALYFFMS